MKSALVILSTKEKIEDARSIDACDGIQVKTVKKLLCTLDSDPAKRLSARIQKQLMDSEGCDSSPQP